MLSLTRDEVIKNQINYYIERIIFLKGSVRRLQEFYKIVKESIK